MLHLISCYTSFRATPHIVPYLHIVLYLISCHTYVSCYTSCRAIPTYRAIPHIVPYLNIMLYLASILVADQLSILKISMGRLHVGLAFELGLGQDMNLLAPALALSRLALSRLALSRLALSRQVPTGILEIRACAWCTPVLTLDSNFILTQNLTLIRTPHLTLTLAFSAACAFSAASLSRAEAYKA